MAKQGDNNKPRFDFQPHFLFARLGKIQRETTVIRVVVIRTCQIQATHPSHLRDKVKDISYSPFDSFNNHTINISPSLITLGAQVK